VPHLTERLADYLRLMRLHRPIGAFLLLWPTLWGIWIASEGRPDPLILLVFVAGVFLMRSAGCVINDYADRDFDPFVQRTRDRPLATGRVTPSEALVLFFALCLVSFGLVLLMNRLTVLLSVAAVALAVTYPFMKRYHHLPQVHLGVAFGWGVPMAFTAETGGWPPAVAWVLLAAVVLWAVAYDTLYAMVDREYDLRIGVKSTAILFGSADLAVVAGVHVAVLLLLVAVGRLAALRWPYYASLVVAAGLAVYQLWLARDRDPARCFRAFLHNNWLGAAVFAGIVASYALEG
jgi:4-hydroxybenzoate polyprenyltransferase